MNIIQSVIQLIKLTEANPSTDQQALFELDQIGQKMNNDIDTSNSFTSQEENQSN